MIRVVIDMSESATQMWFELRLYNEVCRPFSRFRRFSVGGKTFYYGPHGRWLVTHFLVLVRRSESNNNDIHWLIRHRPFIRNIESLCPAGLLTYLIANADASESRRLAIWLRGRCPGSFGTKVLAGFLDAPDYRIRKELVRALHRMHGWAELRRMHENDPDPRIRRMAAQVAIEKFELRSSRFQRNVKRRQINPHELATFVDETVDFGGGLPPKSPTLIRAILKRIQQAVRLGKTGKCT